MFSSVTTWPDFPKGLKVLLLDGDSKDRDCTELLLKEANYEVTTCSCSAEAIAHLKQSTTNFHIVLTDSKLFSFETGDNLQLLRLLKKSRKTLPFLLLSDSSSPSDVLQGVKLGAAEVIPKPLSPLKARTLWQHTVRNMMVKNAVQEQSLADDSDSNSLEHPRTPSADVCPDMHKTCDACSSDSTSNFPDMLSFDLDCEDFSLDRFVGLPESSISLTDKPPTPESFNDPGPAGTSVPTSSPSSSPPPVCSSQCTAISQSQASSSFGYQLPAASSCQSFQQAPVEQRPMQQQQQMPAMSLPLPAMGMHAMAPPMTGMPMWGMPGMPGMPPMPMMPGMMGGCPPFPMMPPFMRPFGPMGMPPMPMPMMPFPMCPMPMGMPHMNMMCPPPTLQMPCVHQPQIPTSAPEQAQAAQQAAWAPAPDCTQVTASAIDATAASGQQQATSQQQQLQAPQQQQQEASAADCMQSAGNFFGDCGALLKMDGPEADDPPLGLQLKKSDSLLDLLSQHLFSTSAACA